MKQIARGFVLSFACWLTIGWSVPQCCLLSRHEGNQAPSPTGMEPHQHHHDDMTDSGGGARLQAGKPGALDCCVSAGLDVSLASKPTTLTSFQTSLVVPVEFSAAALQPLINFSPPDPPALPAAPSLRSAPLRI